MSNPGLFNNYYNFIQTFYADDEAVNKSTEIMLTSIDLFFKSKPNIDNNSSGTNKPQVTMWLCEVINGTPIPENKIKDSTTYVDWDNVSCSTNATTSTTFSFRNPLLLKTNNSYGIVIKFQDSGYYLWQNIRGDALVRESGYTNTPSSGSTSTTDGVLYESLYSNSDPIRYADRDLKYAIKVARFTGANTSVYIVNKDYEFFTVNSVVGGFLPGETVYLQTANSVGTIAFSSTNNIITGTSTIFQNLYEGQDIIIDNGTNKDSVRVIAIESNTQILVNKPLDFNGPGNYVAPVMGKVARYSAPSKILYLSDSNAANATFKFAANDKLIGLRSNTSANVVSLDRYSVDAFVPKFSLSGPVSGSYQLSYKIAVEANTLSTEYKDLSLNSINRVEAPSYILSRSQEVVGSSLYGTDKKSMVAKVDLQVTGTGNRYTAPFIDCEDLDLVVKKHQVNSTTKENRLYTSTANSSYSYTITDFDTETENNGLATSKYISKRVTFGAGIYAEDLKIFLTAYRPAGSEIRVYAKLHNNADVDAFVTKSWTLLELEQNVDKYSNQNDVRDLIEYSYSLPDYPEILSSHGESNLAEYGNTIITTPSSLVASIQENDVIKIYKPEFPDTNHQVYTVSSSNTTTITLSQAIRNTNIVNGVGQPAVAVGIQKLKYKTSAFNNFGNDNVSRYYTTSKTEFDNFNTMQIKIVLLSDASNKNPRVETIQAIGVSV